MMKYLFPQPYYVIQVENLTFLPMMRHIENFQYELVPHTWIAPNGDYMSTEEIFVFAQRNNVGFKRMEYYPNVRK